MRRYSRFAGLRAGVEQRSRCRAPMEWTHHRRTDDGQRSPGTATLPVALLRDNCSQRICSKEAEMAKAAGKGNFKAVDADTLLAEDHRKVEGIFEEFKKLTGADAKEKEDLVRMACAELKIHATLEEEIFYPAAREKLDETSLVDEAQVEHAVLKQLIGEPEEMPPDEELTCSEFPAARRYRLCRTMRSRMPEPEEHPTEGGPSYPGSPRSTAAVGRVEALESRSVRRRRWWHWRRR